MTALTLHVPWHVPLFSIRSSESQGFSLDFGQHVSAAGLSWTPQRPAGHLDVRGRRPHTNTPQSVPNVFNALNFFTLCLSLVFSQLPDHALNVEPDSNDSDCLPTAGR